MAADPRRDPLPQCHVERTTMDRQSLQQCFSRRTRVKPVRSTTGKPDTASSLRTVRLCPQTFRPPQETCPNATFNDFSAPPENYARTAPKGGLNLAPKHLRG